MKAIIKPSLAKGDAIAPPSKSLAHRYIICAALSKGVSRISNVDYSEDIKATLDCVQALGATVDISEDVVTITGIDATGSRGRTTDSAAIEFKCRESGSTMRFFMGIAMYFGRPSYFYGSTTLRNRPFGIYEQICQEASIIFNKEEDRIYLEGTITAGDYEIAGNISSQFITGLLFILPLLEEDSRIKLIPPIESRSYINLTLQSLKAYGVNVVWENDETLYIKGGQQYEACDIAVEGDCSNAAFLESFNTCGGSVNVLGINEDTLQGDRVYKELFDKLCNNTDAVIDISDCPDLGPVLFAVAALNNGGTFTGTRRLKIKESDRGSVMCAELAKFKTECTIGENTIVINKSSMETPKEPVLGHNDHRIVMSLSLLLTKTGGEVTECEAVRKSYPGFFDDIQALGIEVDISGMD